MDNPKDENKLIAERRKKLDELRERGNAYPNAFRRDSLAAQLHASFGERSREALDNEQVRVSVAGRLMAKRVMGKTSFVKIQDRTGQIQLWVERPRVGDDIYRDFKSWDLGDIVAGSGVLAKTKSGELSVRVDRFELLVKALRPLPDKWHGLSDQELRYRQRYVDLIVNETTRKTFRARARVITFMRSFLDALDFMEVETPMMQPIPGGAVARPFVTHHNALDMSFYLRVAPELYLKRLLVGGFERVYEINRNFRNEGLSTQHNPEFTMLELYQAYGDYQDVMAYAEALVRESARTVTGATSVDYQGTSFDFGQPFARTSVLDSILHHNPGLDAGRLRDVAYLREVCQSLGVSVEKSWGAGKLQAEVFEQTVEDKLQQPIFVTHYPAEVSPLSRANDEDPFVTDRFELFIYGREIANGFSELNDPEEQAERFRAQAQAKAAGDDEAMFFDEDYIRSLEYGMPPAGGLGVGIDRLVMLLTDAASIRDVLLFPHLRPEER